MERIECKKLCKITRKLLRENHREHNILSVMEGIESGKILKNIKEKKEGLKALISVLQEQDGTITTNNQRVFERCAGFYENV